MRLIRTNENEDMIVEDYLCAKLHLVDLAGSERAKRTGSDGLRFKEGTKTEILLNYFQVYFFFLKYFHSQVFILTEGYLPLVMLLVHLAMKKNVKKANMFLTAIVNSPDFYRYVYHCDKIKKNSINI